MRIFLLSFFICNAFISFAQKNTFSLRVAFRPELTTYKEEHVIFFDEEGSTSHLNAGIQIAALYNITKHVFIETGMGFVNRKFNLVAFFDQSAIPPPRQSFTNELVHTRRVFYRTFELPIVAGYQFCTDKKLGFNLQAGYLFNYLWNAKYKTTSPKYDGTYTKRYWLGSTPIVALGAEYWLKQNLSISSSFHYLFQDMDKKDACLYGAGATRLAISHNYLSLSIGVKKQF